MTASAAALRAWITARGSSTLPITRPKLTATTIHARDPPKLTHASGRSCGRPARRRFRAASRSAASEPDSAQRSSGGAFRYAIHEPRAWSNPPTTSSQPSTRSSTFTVSSALPPNGSRLSCGAKAGGRKRPALRYELVGAQTHASPESRPRQLQAHVRRQRSLTSCTACCAPAGANCPWGVSRVLMLNEHFSEIGSHGHNAEDARQTGIGIPERGTATGGTATNGLGGRLQCPVALSQGIPDAAELNPFTRHEASVLHRYSRIAAALDEVLGATARKGDLPFALGAGEGALVGVGSSGGVLRRERRARKNERQSAGSECCRS